MVNYDLLEDNGWQPDFEQLEAMGLTDVKIMWTNYPNMPTGGRATRELYEKIVNFARNHNIVVVNDNPYDFILNEGEHLSQCGGTHREGASRSEGVHNPRVYLRVERRAICQNFSLCKK